MAENKKSDLGLRVCISYVLRRRFRENHMNPFNEKAKQLRKCSSEVIFSAIRICIPLIDILEHFKISISLFPMRNTV